MTISNELSNPWTQRFEPLPSIAEIRSRSRIDAVPLLGLLEIPVDIAVAKVKFQMDNIFVPSTQVCTILEFLIHIAYAHSLERYTDRNAFNAQCYSASVTHQTSQQVTCITGPAGAGKTHIIKALGRILPADGHAKVGRDDDSYPLMASLHYSINSDTAGSRMFEAMYEKVNNGTSCTSAKNIDRQLAKLLHGNGVSLIVTDEFQFLSQGATANTAVTKLLFRTMYLGIPFVYVTNYSLIHKILKRPQQDQQRLLSNPIVLQPEPCESDDWKLFVQEFCHIAPEVFNDSLPTYAPVIGRYCACLGRALGALLLIAFRTFHRNRRKIGLPEIEAAYHSMAYTSYRNDVEILNRQLITGKKEKGRLDLWCPFDLPRSQQQVSSNQMTMQRDEKVAQLAVLDTLSVDETKVLRAKNVHTKDTQKLEKATVTSIAKSKRNKKDTIEDLLANAQLLKES